MTPSMEIALGARHVIFAGLLRIEFPGYTLRLTDCSAVITATIDGTAQTFVGKDARFGTIGAIETISETAGDTMPGLDLVLMPPDLTAAVDLAQPAMQGVAVRAWLAALDLETGLPVSDPELLFAGEVDTVALAIDRGSRVLEVSCMSVFERLMEPDEGARLADSFHQWVWPGELGFANMTGTPIERLWGPGAKPPSVTLAAQLPRTGVQLFF